MNSYPKVLVGTVTHDGQEYAFDRFITALKDIDYPNFDIIVVDTSENEDYYEKLKQVEGIRVEKCIWTIQYTSRLSNGLNMLRKHLIYGGDQYDYLFSIDSDVIVPPDILTKLVNQKKELIGAPVPIGFHEVGIPCVLKSTNAIREAKGGIRLDYMTWEEIGDKPIKVIASGLGCLLIHREILKNVQFKNIVVLQWAPDVVFLIECVAKGFEFWCDPTIKVEHLQRRENWENVVARQNNLIEGRFQKIIDGSDKVNKVEGSLKEIKGKLSIPEARKEYDLVEEGRRYQIW